jgi:Notch-like protein
MKSVALTVASLAMLTSVVEGGMCLWIDPSDGSYDPGCGAHLNPSTCSATAGVCGWVGPSPIANCANEAADQCLECSETYTLTADPLLNHCYKDCEVSAWTTTACAVQCDGTADNHWETRSVIQFADDGHPSGAASCGDLAIASTCNTQSCIAGCQTQSSPTECTACVNGFSLAAGNTECNIDNCMTQSTWDQCTACNSGYTLNAGNAAAGGQCIDTVDCTSTTCTDAAHGACSEDGAGTGLTSCACVTGWEGAACADDVKDCKDTTCTNSAQGSCAEDGSGTGNTVCTCAAGWEGTDCNTDTVDCTATTCTNSAQGSCAEDGAGTGNTVCTCVTGWEGTDCNTDTVDCTATTCANAGTCSENGSGTGLTSCDCSTAHGFSGTLCDECAAGKGFVANGGGQGTCTACADPNVNNVLTHDAPCAAQECAEGYGVTSDGHPGVTAGWIATEGNCELCAAGYESAAGCGQCGDVNECVSGSVLIAGVQVAHTAPQCGGSSSCRNEVGTDEFICDCADGWVGGGADALCTECQPGTYKSGNTCADCGAGKYLTTAGSNTETDCVDCGAGKYVEASGSTLESDCDDCGAGKYVTGTGHTLESDCVNCVGGKYVEDPGSVAASDCEDCEAGKYVLAAGSTLESDCTECDAGQFQENDGATECKDCLAGQYQTTPGHDGDECDFCDIRHSSSEVGATLASTCQPCAYCFEANAARDACSVQLHHDCVEGPWTAWGACSASCSEGLSYKTREIITPTCHTGRVCYATKADKICINEPCACEKVLCKWENHDCTDYTATEPGIVNGGTLNTAGGNVYHTNKIASAYVRNVGMENVGTEVSFSPTVNQEDTHDYSLMCNNEQTVRVHHDKDEPLSSREIAGALSTGHHCKNVGGTYVGGVYTGGICQCRCHSKFHNGYNPKSSDLFAYSCGQGEDENC